MRVNKIKKNMPSFKKVIQNYTKLGNHFVKNWNNK